MNDTISLYSEDERIDALLRYQILDTPPENAFDRITALTAKLLNMPVAVVSLVDTDRIWFKSHYGITVTEVVRCPGLCSSVILGNEPYILTDALYDPRSSENPLVTSEFGLRFYAGVPLRTRDGYILGAFCCLDFKPRTITEEHIEILRTLAGVIIDQMELRLAARRVDELHQKLIEAHEVLKIQASHDSLTKIWNRSAIMELLRQTLERSQREKKPMSIIIVDIDFFKKINDTQGHPVGDEVIVTVVNRIQYVFRDSDFIGRIGGEEFLGIMYPCNTQEAERIAERCRQAICTQPIPLGKDSQTSLNVTISGGFFSNEQFLGITAQEMIEKADNALYVSKQKGRNRMTVGV